RRAAARDGEADRGPILWHCPDPQRHSEISRCRKVRRGVLLEIVRGCLAPPAPDAAATGQPRPCSVQQVPRAAAVPESPAHRSRRLHAPAGAPPKPLQRRCPIQARTALAALTTIPARSAYVAALWEMKRILPRRRTQLGAASAPPGSASSRRRAAE